MGEKGRKRNVVDNDNLEVEETERRGCGKEDEEGKDEKRLGQLVYAEIRKVYTLISSRSSSPQLGLDSKGVIEVLKAILKHPASELEQQQFLEVLKLEECGNEKKCVTFAEFLPVITRFLYDGGATNDENTNKRRKLADSAETKREIHKMIKGVGYVIEQTQQQQQEGEEVRKRMASLGSGDITPLEPSLSLDHLFSLSQLEFLQKFRVSIVEETDSIVFGLKTLTLDNLLPSVSKLYELLRIVEVFPTAGERRRVADEVLQVFTLVLQQGFVEPLVKSLYLQHALLQHQALNALRLIAPGPDIPDTPLDHILHPNKMFFKRAIYTQYPFAVITEFLNGNNNQLCNDALAFITTFARHHPDSRDAVLQQSALPAILSMASLPSQPPVVHAPSHHLYPLNFPPQPATNDADLVNVVRTLVVLLGVSHPISKLPPWLLNSTALPVVASLLFANDPDVLVTILAPARFLFIGVPDSAVRARLIELLTSHPSPQVKKATLKTLDGIFKYDKQLSELLFSQSSVIAVLHTLLCESDPFVQSAVCEALAVIAHYHPSALLESGTIALVLGRIVEDSKLNVLQRVQHINILKKAVRGPQSLLRHSIEQDIVEKLCKTLNYVKSLTPTPEKETGLHFYELANGITDILEVIVYTGEAAVTSINNFALVFDLGCVTEIHSLLLKVKDETKQFINLFDLWTKKGINLPTHTLEDRCKYILGIVFKAHTARVPIAGEESQKSQEIIETITQFNGDLPAYIASHTKILISCTYNEDARVIATTSDVTLSHLKSLIEQKYGIIRPSLAYQTVEGKDNVVIDSKETLHTAIAQSKTENASSLQINVTVTPPTPQPRKTSPATPTKSLHANLTPTLSPTSSFQKSALAPLLTPLDLDAMTMDLQNLETIKGQERKVLLESLIQTLHFSLKEVEELHAEWSNTQPKGENGSRVPWEKLVSGKQTDPVELESYRVVFTDGKVNYRQFIASLGTLTHATLEDKLRFVFRVYDEGNNKGINKHDLFDIVRATLMAQNRCFIHHEFNQLIEESFSSKEKHLSCEEFLNAVMVHPPLVHLFNISIPGLSL